MPDTPSIPTLTTEDAPPSGDGWRPDLAALRARLDDLDDKIHDLLMERARVVEGVARSGKTAAFRPGREAAILRRLLARHQGHLPGRTLVRMWREMLAGTTAMQSPVVVAVAGRSDAVPALAREHFGFLTQVTAYPSEAAALAAVRTGDATVAILPFPAAEGWWLGLPDATPRLYIVARLPFWSDRPKTVPAADVLVVAAAAPDASGDDRTFLLAPERPVLADAGLPPLAMHGRVAEVAGLVTQDDPRLPAGSIVLGSFARPVSGDHA